MTATQDILSLGLSAQALALAGENVKLATKKDKNVGDFTKTGLKNIVGISLIKTQAGIIAGL